MLLRRITEHVKAQNWTAVALDFFIVVVGVFIGIQVSNWNDVRGERAQEAFYIERLHDEAQTGVDGLLGFAEKYYEERIGLFHEAVDILQAGRSDVRALSDAQCDVIGQMHDFIALPFQFPSLVELESSGQLGVIRDSALRQGVD